MSPSQPPTQGKRCHRNALPERLGSVAQARSSRLTIQVIRPSEAARASNSAMVMDDISRSTDYPSRAATPGLQAVFVYGTLMRGHRNHGWLAGARFLGRGCLGGAVLYDLGPFPMAVEMDGCFPVASPSASASPSSPTPSTENGVIHGEVYAVNEAQLGDLDRLEGVPRLYRRQRLVLLDGREVWVNNLPQGLEVVVSMPSTVLLGTRVIAQRAPVLVARGAQ